MKQHYIAISCIILAMAVAFGAFGAHALKDTLSTEQLNVWKTATHYQFIHGIAILVLSIVFRLRPSKWLNAAIVSFIVGIIFFSGSLFLLTTLGWKWLGPVTPLGGLAFIFGWIFTIFGLKESLKNAELR